VRFGLTYQYSDRFLRFPAATMPTSSVSRVSTVVYLPGKSEVGAMISYGHKVGARTYLHYSLNVTNLFNEEEITVAAYAPPGREIRFTAGLRF
jgi:hypothetical protein